MQVALTALLYLAIALQVRVEERALEASIGAPYRAYRRKVRRWI